MRYCNLNDKNINEIIIALKISVIYTFNSISAIPTRYYARNTKSEKYQDKKKLDS